MRCQPGEIFRTLSLAGRVVACSDQYAFVDFGASGFLSLATGCYGEYDAVMTLSIPTAMIGPAAIAEVRRCAFEFFSVHPQTRCLVRASRPLDFQTESHTPPAQHPPSNQPLSNQAPLNQPTDAGQSANEAIPIAQAVGPLHQPPRPQPAFDMQQQAPPSPMQYQPIAPGSYTPGSPYAPHHSPPLPPLRESLTATYQDLSYKARSILGRPEVEEELYSVPRRYDLASMFAISIAYSMLFALLKALDTPPIVIMLSGIFFAVVGAAQAVLFDAKKPREASMLAGAIYAFVATVLVAIWGGMRPDSAIFSVFCALFWGAPVGYLAGTMIGGIWLVADYLRQWSERRAGQHT